MPNVDDPFPDSIRDYLDGGGDIRALPDSDGLVDAVTHARAAGDGAQQLAIARAMLAELEEHGALALPADLFDSDEARAVKAAEWLRWHRWVVDLLSDPDLADRFDEALPPARLAEARAAGLDWRRRTDAIDILERHEGFAGFDHDQMSTGELERLADHLRDGGTDRD